MSIIKRLPESLAQKIAAGEVVTRPESVVKELLENAIDAKAQNITIVLKDAGRTLIQVVDDGAGMSREDARIAIERHATSKLAAFDDLEHLMSYGFRGEALAAIASVSQFEMRTRQATDELGTLVEVEGGIFRKCESTACDEGTSISVRNLFFNVPARRKFMKSEATEFKHVVDTVTKAALAHIEIKFIFVSDGDIIFDLPALVPLPERVEQIFGSRLRNARATWSHKLTIRCHVRTAIALFTSARSMLWSSLRARCARRRKPRSRNCIRRSRGTWLG